jgi:hypothetical protein
MSQPAETPPVHRREKFLPDEDARLRELVRLHGPKAWDRIAKEMPGRKARQCRERWKHYVSSEKSSFEWTAEEDHLLFEKMQEHGPKWTVLSQFFPGRTDMQVKTRWMQKFATTSQLHLKNKAIPPACAQPVPLMTAAPIPQMYPAVIILQPGYPFFQFAPASYFQT